MSTFILRTDSVIKNPQYGKLPDLKSGLRFALDARDLQLTDGAIVDNWTSKIGEGASGEKTFDKKLGNFSYPVYRVEPETGMPTVVFNKTSMIVNNNNDKYFSHKSTYLLVLKTRDYNPPISGVSRVFVGDTADNIASATNSIPSNTSPSLEHTLMPYDGQYVTRMGIEFSPAQYEGEASYISSTGQSPINFTVIAITYDGLNSSFYHLENGVSTKITHMNWSKGGWTSYQDRIALGASFVTDHKNSAYDGSISYFAHYDRVLADAEIRSAIMSLSEVFNFSNV